MSEFDEQRLVDILDDLGVSYHTNARSVVIHECPKCGGKKVLLVFRDNGVGSCRKCEWKFGPVGLLIGLGMDPDKARELFGKNRTAPVESLDLDAISMEQTGPRMEPPPSPEPVQFPMPPDFFPLLKNPSITQPGIDYCRKRGLTDSQMEMHDLRYCPSQKRVVIPVRDRNGILRGWQARDITGRAINKIDSPQGFQKGLVLMGSDLLRDDVPHLILSEGPFDHIALDILGNSVCSMGADVSARQIEMIKSMNGVEHVFLALDPDVYHKLKPLHDKIYPDKQVWLLRPPEDKKYWIDKNESKSDFGNTTAEGIIEAWKNAKLYSPLETLSDLNFKGQKRPLW